MRRTRTWTGDCPASSTSAMGLAWYSTTVRAYTIALGGARGHLPAASSSATLVGMVFGDEADATSPPVPWFLWCGVAAVTSGIIGGHLDISWHRSVRPDTF